MQTNLITNHSTPRHAQHANVRSKQLAASIRSCSVCKRCLRPHPGSRYPSDQSKHVARFNVLQPPACFTASGEQQEVYSSAASDKQEQQPNLNVAALYTSLVYSPPRQIADISVETIPGQGAGLISQADFRTGDLIMLIPPLSVVYGPEGAIPETSVLSKAICASQDLTPSQLRWLELLHRVPEGPLTNGVISNKVSLPALQSALATLTPTEEGTTSVMADAADASKHSSAAELVVQEGGTLTTEQQQLRCQELQQLLNGVWSQQQQPDVSHQTPSPAVENSSTSSMGPDPINEQQGLKADSSQSDSTATKPLTDSSSGGTQETTAVASQSSQLLEGAVIVDETITANSNQGEAKVLIQPTAASTTLPKEAGHPSRGKLDKAWVMQAISLNVLTDRREDRGVSELRQQEPVQSYCGLWPEFALLNHSCAPNTVHLMVGGYLLVRASRPISAGEQLTTCYLGEDRLLHVAARRASLKQQFGFHCNCDRCQLEQRLFPTVKYPQDDAWLPEARRQSLGPVSNTLQWTLDRVVGPGRYVLGVADDPGLLAATNKMVMTLAEPGLQEALTAPPFSAVRQRAQLVVLLQAAVKQVEEALKALNLSSRDELLLQASVFGIYRLLGDISQLLPGLLDVSDEVAILQQRDIVMDAVSRGTDSHLWTITSSLSRYQRLYGRDSPQWRKAQLDAAKAYIARYGPLPTPMIQQLMEIRQQAALASRLGQRLGVLAWDNSPDEPSKTPV